jgi:hypothetical protein
MPTAARLAPPPSLTATRLASFAPAEVTAFAKTATSRCRDCNGFIGLGALRSEEAQGGSRDGSAGELYCLTPRDCAGVQTYRQFVEGANTSFVSLHQHEFLLSLHP